MSQLNRHYLDLILFKTSLLYKLSKQIINLTLIYFNTTNYLTSKRQFTVDPVVNIINIYINLYICSMSLWQPCKFL